LLKAEALAGFLRLAPWIADPTARAGWLEGVLAEVRALAEPEAESPATEADLVLRMSAILSRGNQDEILLKPLEQALVYFLADIDRVLADEHELGLLQEAILVGASLRARWDRSPDALLRYFEQVLPGLVRCRNVRVGMLALSVFMRFVADSDNVSNET